MHMLYSICCILLYPMHEGVRFLYPHAYVLGLLFYSDTTEITRNGHKCHLLSHWQLLHKRTKNCSRLPPPGTSSIPLICGCKAGPNCFECFPSLDLVSMPYIGITCRLTALSRKMRSAVGPGRALHTLKKTKYKVRQSNVIVALDSHAIPCNVAIWLLQCSLQHIPRRRTNALCVRSSRSHS